MKNALLALFTLISISIQSQTLGSGYIDYEGNQYETVIIGNQEWMTSNLRTTKFSNGEPIPYQVLGVADNTSPTQPRCFKQDNSDTNIVDKGVLYNWFAINNSNFVANPQDGWHIPTQAEWQELNNFITQVPLLTKINGSILWTPTPVSTNQYNFSLLPTGGVTFNTNNSIYAFNNGNTSSQFWTNVSWNNSNAIAIQYVCNPNIITFQPSTAEKRQGRSIRLVRNANLSTNSFDKTEVKIYPNPAHDILNIEIDKEINSIQIFDLLGKKVMQFKNISKIDISSLNIGIYIFVLEIDNVTITKKIVKK